MCRERRLRRSVCALLASTLRGVCGIGAWGLLLCWAGCRGTAKAAPASRWPSPEGQTLGKLRLRGGDLPGDMACNGPPTFPRQPTLALWFPGSWCGRGMPALVMRDCLPTAGLGGSSWPSVHRACLPRASATVWTAVLTAWRAQPCFLEALAWGPLCSPPGSFVALPCSLTYAGRCRTQVKGILYLQPPLAS